MLCWWCVVTQVLWCFALSGYGVAEKWSCRIFSGETLWHFLDLENTSLCKLITTAHIHNWILRSWLNITLFSLKLFFLDHVGPRSRKHYTTRVSTSCRRCRRGLNTFVGAKRSSSYSTSRLFLQRHSHASWKDSSQVYGTTSSHLMILYWWVLSKQKMTSVISWSICEIRTDQRHFVDRREETTTEELGLSLYQKYHFEIKRRLIHDWIEWNLTGYFVF